MLAGNPSDHPDDVSDCVTLLVKRNPRARDELEPLQLAAPSSTRVDVGPRHLPLYNQRPEQAQDTLLPTTEARGTRRHTKTRTRRESQGADADQPARKQQHQVK